MFSTQPSRAPFQSSCMKSQLSAPSKLGIWSPRALRQRAAFPLRIQVDYKVSLRIRSSKVSR